MFFVVGVVLSFLVCVSSQKNKGSQRCCLPGYADNRINQLPYIIQLNSVRKSGVHLLHADVQLLRSSLMSVSLPITKTI